MKQAIKKIRSRHGETIGEMLVSSLIIALAIIMLVTMVNISTRLVNRSVKNRDAAFDAENTAETTTPSMTTGGSLTISVSPENNPQEANGPSGNIVISKINANVKSLAGGKYAVTYQKGQQSNENNQAQ